MLIFLGLLFLGLGVLAVFACIRSAQISGQERQSPARFGVLGADGKIHTMTRRPAVDPPPCPDSAPGEVSFPSPGTNSPEAEEHSR